MKEHASIKRISKVDDKELRFSDMKVTNSFIIFKNVELLEKNNLVHLKSLRININTVDDIEITTVEK